MVFCMQYSKLIYRKPPYVYISMLNEEVLKYTVKYSYLFKIDTYHLLKNVKAKVACDEWLTSTGSQVIIIAEDISEGVRN